MDKLAGLASKLGGSQSTSANQTQGQPQGQQEDFVDKGTYPPPWLRTHANVAGLDALEQRFGGGKIDSAKMRSTNEKITDAAREQFEKATGYKVPEKFSN
ncbi:hypothetical protein CNMCM8980_007332 [Aspergillus fumigatiaffinis]|uniref:Uncharacterized protein n=1 Tax=Aspergillus fumigatiaffinis TaxID=340414 RepID=A0A8H4MB43_9EURO|nr:hypothetical protein CNMCM5878_006859 [Aspergillus fumigatiaffinis]KAF4231378.1 hypothetical protein CNMCM6457_005482 [Aspergillus fumigatiaffinis]KAF4236821.1 hypothetical protein CNMCM6805_007216 [Aspergillus fumigatiaffinis]KAF4247421.1 hypothetical protein CNMCM8980_007332 [Aspergillus fumigatiaffinis]